MLTLQRFNNKLVEYCFKNDSMPGIVNMQMRYLNIFGASSRNTSSINLQEEDIFAKVRTC